MDRLWVGDDGLTRARRAALAAEYANTVGRTPESSPTRTFHVQLMAGKVEPQPWRRRTTEV
jgi:hypothetical protein